jgi:hypothetical protein
VPPQVVSPQARVVGVVQYFGGGLHGATGRELTEKTGETKSAVLTTAGSGAGTAMLTHIDRAEVEELMRSPCASMYVGIHFLL